MRYSVMLLSFSLFFATSCNLFERVEPEGEDSGSPGLDMGAPGDMAEPPDGASDLVAVDMPVPTDVGKDVPGPTDGGAVDACSAESDAALCAGASANCGTIEVTDSCGDVRTVECGTCMAPSSCGAETDNVCGCVAEDDAAFCARLGKNCGTVVDVDDCGAVRAAECGTCTAPETCGADNVCACTPESDEEFCTRLGKDCGTLNADDNCGMARSANCGTCSNGEMCGSTEPNVCGCACMIAGTCYGEGARNPTNPCEVCDSARSASAWSVNVGATCDDGDGCTSQDVCDAQGGCSGQPIVCDGGECADAVCDPATGDCVTTPKADLTPCSDDGAACTADYCDAGVCTHPVTTGCFIDGSCYDANFAADTCRRCKPATSATTWTVPQNTCGIDGECWDDGAENPANPCETCASQTDPLAWTVKPDGRPCASNQECLCFSGTCEDAMSGGECMQ